MKLKLSVSAIGLLIISTCSYAKVNNPDQSVRLTTNLQLQDQQRMSTGLGFYLLRPNSEKKLKKYGIVYSTEGSTYTKETSFFNDTVFNDYQYMQRVELSLRSGTEYYQPISSNFKFMAGTEYMVGFGRDQSVSFSDYTIRNSDSIINTASSKFNAFRPFVGFMPSFGALLNWGKLGIGFQLELPIVAGALISKDYSIFDFDIRPISTKLSLQFKL